MEHRIGKAGALACTLSFGVVACAAPGQQPSDGAAPLPLTSGAANQTSGAANTEEQLPSLVDSDIGPGQSRKLGTFSTVAEAIAAAKAAQLAPGTYGTAIVGSRVLAIDPAGKAYNLLYLGGSGKGQRPPQ